MLRRFATAANNKVATTTEAATMTIESRANNGEGGWKEAEGKGEVDLVKSSNASPVVNPSGITTAAITTTPQQQITTAAMGAAAAIVVDNSDDGTSNKQVASSTADDGWYTAFV